MIKRMNMKKIVFIGDSILYGVKGIPGYGYFVKQHYTDRAQIVLPSENCQGVRDALDALDVIFDTEDLKTADVIHWNSGHWDVLHFMGSPLTHTPLAIYVTSIEKLYRTLRELNPTAKIVFATTTRVCDELRSGKSYRLNSEIEEYNGAAVGVLEPLGVYINDLYRASAEIDSLSVRADSVHFNAQGSSLLSEFVIEYIERLL